MAQKATNLMQKVDPTLSHRCGVVEVEGGKPRGGAAVERAWGALRAQVEAEGLAWVNDHAPTSAVGAGVRARAEAEGYLCELHKRRPGVQGPKSWCVLKKR